MLTEWIAEGTTSITTAIIPAAADIGHTGNEVWFWLPINKPTYGTTDTEAEYTAAPLFIATIGF